MAARKGGFRVGTAFVTLTYRPDAEWQPRHISELQEHYRKWLQRRGVPIRGFWVLEQTKAGVPHYHLVLWLPRGLTPPKPDKQGWWKHGHTRVEWARNPTGYLVKYASKADTATAFPEGARLYGVRGLGEFRPSFRHQMRPFWLQERCSVGDRLTRRPGGGWLNVTTGEVIASPWVVVARDRCWRWVEFERRETA